MTESINDVDVAYGVGESGCAETAYPSGVSVCADACAVRVGTGGMTCAIA